MLFCHNDIYGKIVSADQRNMQIIFRWSLYIYINIQKVLAFYNKR
jgi:hypothetical protein